MRKLRLGSTASGIKPNDIIYSAEEQQLRTLRATCEPGTRHCVSPEELDVESQPITTRIPTFSPSMSPALIVEAGTKVPISVSFSSPTPGSIMEGPTTNAFFYFNVTTKSPSLAPATMATRIPSTDSLTISPTFQPTAFDVNENAIEPTETPTTTPDFASTYTLVTSTPASFSDHFAPTVFPTLTLPTRRPMFLTPGVPTNKLPTQIQNTLPTRPSSTSTPSVTPSMPTRTPTIKQPTPAHTPIENTLPTRPSSISTPSVTLTENTTYAQTNASESGGGVSLNSTLVVRTFEPTMQMAAAPSSYPTPFPNQPNSPPTAPFQPSEAAPLPTAMPQSSTQTSCVADSNGGFGLTVPVYVGTGATNVRFVEYQYQVETTPKFEITSEDLNGGILWNLEKAISNLLVAALFPPSKGYYCETNDDNYSVTTKLLRAISNDHRFVGNTNTSIGGDETSGSDSSNSIVGLAADPPDLVRTGTGEVTCPYKSHSTNDEKDMDVSSCFVIGGELTIFTGSTFDSTDDLSWVDNMVMDELELAMNTGALDLVDPAISFVRYIPTTYETNFTEDSNGELSDNSVATEENQDNDNLTSSPAWSWMLAGFGFLGLGVVIFVMTLYRRRRMRGGGNNVDTATRNPTGAFPGPVEIVDDNSEFDNEIYKDDEEDDENVGVPSRPASWRQVPEIKEEGRDAFLSFHINATDPYQLVVRPILDEEAETYIKNT